MAKTTTTAAATTTTRRARNKRAEQPVIAVHHMVSAEGLGDDAALSELMAMLDAPTAGAPDEVIEAAVNVDEDLAGAAALPEVDESTLSAALVNAEAAETSLAAATLEEGEEIGDSDAAEAGAMLAEAAAPEGEADAEAGAKKERTPRKHYTNKADRIVDRLGDKLPEFTVLTISAASALDTDEAIKANMEETMAIIRSLNKKEQNRAGFLMEFISGKKAKLNEVLERTLRVLHADGKITTGKDGNLLANLLAKPYSPASARAQMGNTIGMFEALKLIKKDSKGNYSANPESLLLATANSKLGLGSVEAAPV